jgi:DNA-binding GntR family transcriptional regulator
MTGSVNRTSIAYDSLKKSILTNVIKPGDYLSENQVAQSLGMSRTPVREAIKVLASEGLVEIHNGVGIFVKRVTTKEISDLFEVRAELECLALHTALDNISEHEMDAIYAEWTKQKKKVEAGQKIDLDHVLRLDFQLHCLIVDRCGNEFLKNVIDGIRTKIMRYQRISAMAFPDEEDMINQHLQITGLMRLGDLDVLSKMLKKHILKAADNIIRNPHWAI